MKRWVCPSCQTGKLAPERPRKDDVRRFCLPCSERTGRLVERRCPTLEQKRAEAAAQRRERAKRRRAAAARKRAAASERQRQKEVAAGCDLRDLLSRWSKLDAWRDGAYHAFRMRGLPEMVVRRGSDNHAANWHPAHAQPSRHRITMTIPRSWDAEPTAARAAAVMVTLLHEMAHLAVRQHRHGEAHHDDFNRLFCAAAEEVWGIEVGYRYGDGGYAPTRRVQELLIEQLKKEFGS